MFSSRQVMSASTMVRQFCKLARELEREPQALLLTQKGKKPLVLVSAEIFEGLIQDQFRLAATRRMEATLRDVGVVSVD